MKLGIGTVVSVGFNPIKPPVPTDLAVAVTSDTVLTLSWVSDFAIELWRVTTEEGEYSLIATVDKGTLEYADEELTPATTYYYKARGKNGSKYSEFGSVVSASTFATESVSLFALAVTPPTYSRKIIIDAAIRSFKSFGYWDRLDVLQVYAAHEESFAILDWKGTAVTASKISTPAFEIDRGFTSAATKCINTNFNPVANGSNYKSNDWSWGFYSRTNSKASTASTALDGGHMGETTGAVIRARTTNDQSGILTYTSNKTLSNNVAGSTTDSRGLFVLDRRGANNDDLYIRGYTAANSNITQTSIVDNNIYIGGFNNNGTETWTTTSRQYALFMAGDSFTGAEQLQLWTIIETYMTAIGAGFFFDIILNYNTELLNETEL